MWYTKREYFLLFTLKIILQAVTFCFYLSKIFLRYFYFYLSKINVQNFYFYLSTRAQYFVQHCYFCTIQCLLFVPKISLIILSTKRLKPLLYYQCQYLSKKFVKIFITFIVENRRCCIFAQAATVYVDSAKRASCSGLKKRKLPRRRDDNRRQRKHRLMSRWRWREALRWSRSKKSRSTTARSLSSCSLSTRRSSRSSLRERSVIDQVYLTIVVEIDIWSQNSAILVAQQLGRRTSDLEIMGSIPGPGVIRHLGQLSLPSLQGR